MSEHRSGTPSCLSQSCPTPLQRRLYQTVIFATPILFTLILLLLFCTLYIRRRRIARINSQIRAQFVTNGFFSVPQGQGLSKSFRQRLPVVPFDENFMKFSEDTSCSVCLGDYQPNEKLQRLPVCRHTYHVGCIDEWLSKNTTCPICRTSLIQDGPPMVRELIGGTGRWQDRVLNEHQEGSLNIMRAEALSGVGGGVLDVSLTATADSTLRTSNEHSIDIERS